MGLEGLGGPEAQGGKTARERAGPVQRPRPAGPCPRPGPYRRSAAEDEAAAQGCASEPGARPRRRRSRGARARRRPGPGGLALGPGAGDRRPAQSRPWSSRPPDAERSAPRAWPGRKGQGAPACRAAAAAAAERAAASSALTRPSRGPASPARALAAEQHGQRPLALGPTVVRRRSPRIGRAGGACKE
ncbi:putative HTLV-1-related endogenous sequence [Equus asinus]|uniref:putative HTLV-1-related endogenous sequence n=1 Tax=Equus asinus TaxID=9793 RepID=UPI0038F74B0F